MSDAIKTFEDAIKDRLIDKKDLGNHLSNFTLDDWREVAKNLAATKASKNGLFGGIDELSVQETPTEIVIKNDKDALRDQSILTGAKDVGLWMPTFAAVGAGAGWLASRYCSTPYLKLGGAALGVLAGIWKAKHDQAALDEMQEFHIPKDSLKTGETAMLQQSAGQKLLASNQSRFKLTLG